MNLSTFAPRFGSILPPGGFNGINLIDTKQLTVPVATKLIDNLSKTAQLVSAQNDRKGVVSLGTNAKQYDLVAVPDGTFRATSQDGDIMIRYFHNDRQMGQTTLYYRNNGKPDQTGYTVNPGILSLAKELGLKLGGLLKGESNNDLDL